MNGFRSLQKCGLEASHVVASQGFWRELASSRCCQNLKKFSSELYNCRAPNNDVIMCLAQGNFKNLEEFELDLQRPFSTSEWLKYRTLLYGKLPALEKIAITCLENIEPDVAEEVAAVGGNLLPLLGGEHLGASVLHADSTFAAVCIGLVQRS